MGRLATLLGTFATGSAEWCDTTTAHRDALRSNVMSTLEALGYVGEHGRHRCMAESGGAGAGNPESNTCLFEFPRMLPSSLNSSFQIQDTSDVLVYVGCNPPEPAPLYMGYTPYLAGFDVLSAAKGKPMGQMADTLNHLVMNSTGKAGQPWGSTMALILTADQKSDADARAALVAAAFPDEAVNTIVVPEELLNIGVGSQHNYFVLGGRVGPFLNLADRDAHLANSAEPFLYFHGNKRKAAADPFPTPARRSRIGVHSEVEMQPLIAELLDSVSLWAGQADWLVDQIIPLQPMLRDGVYSNGTQCITNKSTAGCFGDTDDAAYLISNPLLALRPGNLDIIVGANHAATGMAAYSSAAVYTNPAGGGQAQTLGGAAMSSAEYAGSAQRYIVAEDHVNASQLFAIDVKYGGCAPGERWCLNATVTDTEHTVTYVTRAYLNPETGTGPSPDQLVHGFVVRLQRNAALAV
jgi:hypothetical protein